MLQSVKRAVNINPTHPKLHECLVKFHQKGLNDIDLLSLLLTIAAYSTEARNLCNGH